MPSYGVYFTNGFGRVASRIARTRKEALQIAEELTGQGAADVEIRNVDNLFGLRIVEVG